ncbi:Mur ligase family protein [Mesorhizobium neociceri]|uniref:UDP-N-acetylmuramoyl-tripeptide--D-alanyl-D-alanine ligase n=1 Tax=Mesorhizobium neociceri TaxID=1307853 RepID=A0A838B8G5_9HYPH|nr:Mur ligase family protein [Mesorhizobium neociceri]MBA1141670.1 UDP-N-acetylmuramoyl-tripeptide--D-alanyl-D-alanine ligase [Mesorhizobium neociceri]
MRNKRQKSRYDLGWRLRLYLARRARARSKATFIGITGSSGKTTAGSLLGHILAGHGSVYTQVLANTMKLLVSTLSRRMRKGGQTDYVVFEAAAFGPDTMKPMAELLRPDVAVVTMVRLEHRASFKTLESVAHEKRALVAALEPGGFAMLNADDPHVLGMASASDCRTVTFGTSERADYRVSDIEAAYPKPLRFSIHWRGGVLDIETPFPGAHFWLPTVAAVATALELGVPAQMVKDRTATFQPLENRGQVLAPAGGPHFIVDAAKAPWHSLTLAFDMIARSTFGRKRIVLGQLSDFAGSNRKYADAYRSAREIADQVIYAGDHAHRSKASQADRDSGRFIELRTAKEVSDYIAQTAQPDELILIKSSSSLHLERVALAWTHDVRCWVSVCGKTEGCEQCGLYEVPFEQHRKFVAQRKLKRRKHRLLRLLGR